MKIYARAWALLLAAQRLALQSVECALVRAKLPPLAWYDALLELERTGSRGLRPFELQRAMLLAQYNLSRLLDRIEKRGYVERRECRPDGRGQVVVVTKAGLALRRRMWPAYAAPEPGADCRFCDPLPVAASLAVAYLRLKSLQRMRAMIDNELIGQVPENTGEAVASWRQMRVRIHDAFELATTPARRAALLALNQSIMNMAEKGIEAKDLESFREIRGHSYSLLIVKECLIDGRVCPRTAAAVIQRETAAGRMAPSHMLRDLKQMNAFAAHLQRTQRLAQQLAPRPPGAVSRVLGWLLQ
ncbi:MAG: winged helix-turn-helix transcriptional regulator [Gammaproteobacteria bacterium]|nr:winged helix-turn-helix transcriptional regulator [Gammaproteobacteria bacterium]